MDFENIKISHNDYREELFKARYWRMYQDVWKLHKRYYKRIGSNKIWEESVRCADDLCKKYDNSKFIQDLTMLAMSELGRDFEEEWNNAD